MFTGIVEAIGAIRRVEPRDQGLRLEIATGSLPLDDVGIGDSIAVNGVCLTVVALLADSAGFAADVSHETLACTQGLDREGAVNLERALRLSDRLGGHLVSGHVDGIARVVSIAPVGDNRELVFAAPAPLARYLAGKGSATLNGVSLTVNRVEGNHFSVVLIPHTWRVTTLGALAADDPVNLEVDLLARYTERLLGYAPAGII